MTAWAVTGGQGILDGLHLRLGERHTVLTHGKALHLEDLAQEFIGSIHNGYSFFCLVTDTVCAFNGLWSLGISTFRCSGFLGCSGHGGFCP